MPSEPKTLPLFLWCSFVDFMEKESRTKFFYVLISFHKVVKLQIFESDVSDVIPANEQIISTPWLSLHTFVNFVFITYFC